MTDLSSLTQALAGMANSIVKLTTFTKQQFSVHNLQFSSQLDLLMELIRRVKNLEAETVILKSRLTKKVKSLKSRHHTVKTARENNVIISGIPSDCEDSPQRIVDCVFAALGTSDLSHQVNKMRIIKCNSAACSAVTAKVT